ncbi:hypothetical protein TNCV_1827531 [Trichonephila clavipes]|nr:hypothetical protein TNCV_1827531 [Trichonephila clavipes]
MSSEVPVDRWEGVDGLQFVGQAYPTHALLDSSPVNRRLQLVAISGTHLTGLRAYRPMCPKRLYTICLETVVPVAEES